MLTLQSAVSPKATNALDDWNQIVSDAFSGTSVDADGTEFQGQLTGCKINEFSFVKVDAQSSRVHRWHRSHPSRRSGNALIHLQAGGMSINNQRGRAVPLAYGDAALCDPDFTYRVDFKERYQMFVIELPVLAIAAREPGFDLEEAGGRPINPWRSKLLLSFLSSAWDQQSMLGHDPEWREFVSRVGMDLAVSAISGVVQSPVAGASATLRRAVLGYVRDHLSDPELRTSTVGRALGVSRRSVQTVFERMSTTASAFVLEQRLNRAADSLCRKPGRLSITEIAFSCGFSDSAYFSRCFHKKFGVAPRDYKGIAKH